MKLQLIGLILVALREESTAREPRPDIIDHGFLGYPFDAYCDGNVMQMPNNIFISSITLEKSRQPIARYDSTSTIKYHVGKSSWNFISTGISHRPENNRHVARLTMHIPNVTKEHEGVYRCKMEFTGAPFASGRRTLRALSFLYLWTHPSGEANPCKNNWIYWEDQNNKANKFCFNFFLLEKTWPEALKYCKEQHGATLLHIDSARFDNFLKGMVGIKLGYTHYIGMKKDASTWEWESGKAVTFANKPPTSPTMSGCIAINNGQYWFLHDCKKEEKFICQRDTKTYSKKYTPPPWQGSRPKYGTFWYYLWFYQKYIIGGTFVILLIILYFVALYYHRIGKKAKRILGLTSTANDDGSSVSDEPFMRQNQTSVVYAKTLENRYARARSDDSNTSQ